MAKRKPYQITYPKRETRDAVVLRVSGIDNRFSRYQPTQVLMITDAEAATLRTDGWGVEAPDAEPAEPSSPEPQPATTAPTPRRRRRS